MNRIRVALVDDDSSFLRALERLLRAAGFDCLSYPSAEAFLRELPRPSMDCVILDVRLGTISGFDLAGQLAAEGSRAPVIFITAHDAPETQEKARQMGCVAYLRKPFPAESLIEAIRRALPAAQGNT